MIFKLLSTPMLFAVIGGGVWYYYQDNKNTIENLTVRNERIMYAYEECQSSYDELIKQKELIEETRQEFQEKAKKAEEEQNKLFAKIRKHDLTSLTYAKPGLIESRINNATKQIFEDLESLTSE